jgi:tyrosinase-like protein
LVIVMTLNRRAFVKGAGLSLLGGGAMLMVNSPAAAASPKRMSIGTLINSDGSFKAELQSYHDALAKLKSDEPLLWTQLSRFHDIFCTGAGANEVHGNWRFLAWHRAYLLTYERVLREISSNSSIALPYWDWFAADTFPSAFQVGALNHPNRNLNSGGALVITDADRGLRESDNYGTRVPFGPRNSFLGWRGPNGQHGRAEFAGHGGMHNWVGGFKIVGRRRLPDGDMADLDRAANDPCFYSHHGNVDRMWEVWKSDVFNGTRDWERSIPNEWKTLSFQFDFGGGRNYTYNAIDLINTQTAKDADGVTLGYTYDNIMPRHPLPPRPTIVSMAPRSATDATELAESEVRTPEPVQIPLGNVSVGDKSRTTSAPIEAAKRSRAVQMLDEAAGVAAAAREARPSASATPRAEGRAVVRIGRLRLPPRSVQLRFFLNNPDATLESTGIESGFIGSFNFVPSSDQPETVEGFELDVTNEIGGKIEALDSAQVTVVPNFAGQDDEDVTIEDMILEVR